MIPKAVGLVYWFQLPSFLLSFFWQLAIWSVVWRQRVAHALTQAFAFPSSFFQDKMADPNLSSSAGCTRLSTNLSQSPLLNRSFTPSRHCFLVPIAIHLDRCSKQMAFTDDTMPSLLKCCLLGSLCVPDLVLLSMFHPMLMLIHIQVVATLLHSCDGFRTPPSGSC